MSKSPAFQLYAAEFLADENVVMMSNQQAGCYIKLMCYCWREGSIPSDIDRIARLCSEDSQAMAGLWGGLKACFITSPTDPQRLIHGRLDKERIKQADFKKKMAEAGTNGAKKRWGGKKAPKNPENNGVGDSQAIG